MEVDSLCAVGGKVVARIEGEFGSRLDHVREEKKITFVFTDGTQLKLVAKMIGDAPMIADN